MATVDEGLFRFSGMYGAAYRDGTLLGDVTEVTGTITINRVDIPLVGRTDLGHKPGRETREGSLTVQKIDTFWEMEVFNFTSQSLATRRANRDAGRPNLRPFTMVIGYDDPDALGVEKWQLDGCIIWGSVIGFSLADDSVDRQYTFTWTTETPVYAFQAARDQSGAEVASYYPGFGPPPAA